MKNTTLCYIEQNGKYLCLYRNKKENDLNEGKYIGLGGHFEDKESPEDCVLREVLEEAGLTLTHYEYRGIVTFISDRWETEYMHLFWADQFEGTPKECSEGELVWIEKDALLQKTLWQGDKIFLKLLDQSIPFFSLKLVYQGEQLMSAVLNGKEVKL